MSPRPPHHHQHIHHHHHHHHRQPWQTYEDDDDGNEGGWLTGGWLPANELPETHSLHCAGPSSYSKRDYLLLHSTFHTVVSTVCCST